MQDLGVEILHLQEHDDQFEKGQELIFDGYEITEETTTEETTLDDIVKQVRQRQSVYTRFILHNCSFLFGVVFVHCLTLYAFLSGKLECTTRRRRRHEGVCSVSRKGLVVVCHSGKVFGVHQRPGLARGFVWWSRALSRGWSGLWSGGGHCPPGFSRQTDCRCSLLFTNASFAGLYRACRTNHAPNHTPS